MAQKTSIDSIVSRVGDLPAMPNLVSEVLALTDDPMADLDPVSQVLERDPALSAKILRISNSPYYGMKQYVGTLKLALVILGIREVRNIVLGVAVFDTFRDPGDKSRRTEMFTQHSFIVGGVTKKLADQVRLGTEGESFISGLLHDIGKLVLAKQLGSEYDRIIGEPDNASDAVLLAEKEAFGFTHADVGCALANLWNFPETLSDAILLHHPVDDRTLEDAKDPKLAALVRLANYTVHDNRKQDEEEENEPTVSRALADRESWAALESAPSPIPEGERETVLAGLVQELDDSPPPSF